MCTNTHTPHSVCMFPIGCSRAPRRRSGDAADTSVLSTARAQTAVGVTPLQINVHCGLHQAAEVLRELERTLTAGRPASLHV